MSFDDIIVMDDKLKNFLNEYQYQNNEENIELIIKKNAEEEYSSYTKFFNNLILFINNKISDYNKQEILNLSKIDKDFEVNLNL